MFAKLLVSICLVIVGTISLLPAVTLADAYGIDKTLQVTNRGQEILPSTIAGQSTIPKVIGAVVGVLLSMVGIVFFGLTLYAGIKWMMAMGNTEDVEKAKDTLTAAIIGLVIVLAAYAITSFVFSSLGSTTAGSATTPVPGNKTSCEAAGFVCTSKSACTTQGGTEKPDTSCTAILPDEICCYLQK